MPREFDLEDDEPRERDNTDDGVSCTRCGAHGLHWRAVTSATGMTEVRRLVDDQMRKHVCQANANDF